MKITVKRGKRKRQTHRGRPPGAAGEAHPRFWRHVIYGRSLKDLANWSIFPKSFTKYLDFKIFNLSEHQIRRKWTSIQCFFLWECDSDQFFIPHISQFLIEISFFKVICLILLKAWYFDEAIQWTLGNVHWICSMVSCAFIHERYNFLEKRRNVRFLNQSIRRNFPQLARPFFHPTRICKLLV